MKVELLELERDYLEQAIRYNVEILKDHISERGHPGDIVAYGKDLVLIGHILEKLKFKPEPVPNLKPKKKKGVKK